MVHGRPVDLGERSRLLSVSNSLSIFFTDFLAFLFKFSEHFRRNDSIRLKD